MTTTEELEQFSKEKEVRARRAQITSFVFGVMATLAAVSFVYAFYQQSIGQTNAAEYKIELQKMAETLKAAEEEASKFEVLAAEATARANEISDQCHKTNKPK
jgi:hypothetical protein